VDGRLEVFVLAPDGALFHLWQSAPNGAFAAPQVFQEP
jgi:hypothetical protein